MQRMVIALVISGLALAARTADAQERGQVGLSMGYPEAVQLLWHATDAIAVRPGVSWRHSFSDPVGFSFGISDGFGNTISTTSSSQTTIIGVGVDILLSVRAWENVRAYVAPGYEYGSTRVRSMRTTVSTGARAAPTENETRETSGHDHVVTGAFGVRYTPHRRFGVFGESGIEYSKSRTTFPGFEGVTDATTKYQAWSTVTRVGVIVYF